MLTKNIAEMTARVDAHLAADLLVQGNYYEVNSGRGCFIGCFTKGNDPRLIADKFGFPVMLTRVLENVFEALPLDEAKQFFADIPRAVKDGVDLSKVVWAFLASELRLLPSADGKLTSAIDAVICGMDLRAAGKAWPGDADARADAAYYCADDATRAFAAYAARAATSAADAASAVRASESAAAFAAYAARAARAASAAKYADAAVARAAAYAARIRQRDTLLTLMREAA